MKIGAEKKTGLTPEQRSELTKQALLQSEVNLENARINHVLAKAARDALLAETPEE